MKKEAKLRLICWILLLQEFNLEHWDKKGSEENLMADHLSRILTSQEFNPINDKFPDEQFLAAYQIFPRYADMVNYLAAGELPEELTRHEKNKVKSD